MAHTAHRHGRTITLKAIRRGLAVTVRHPQLGDLNRGRIITRGIRDQHIVWQPITHDHVWLDEVCGDYVDAERALLDATTELDQPVTWRQMAATTD